MPSLLRRLSSKTVGGNPAPAPATEAPEPVPEAEAKDADPGADEHAAAAKMQAVARGRAARRQTDSLKAEAAAAAQAAEAQAREAAAAARREREEEEAARELAMFRTFMLAGFEVMKQSRKGSQQRRIVWMTREFDTVYVGEVKRVFEEPSYIRRALTGSGMQKHMPVAEMRDVQPDARNPTAFVVTNDAYTLTCRVPDQKSRDFIVRMMRRLFGMPALEVGSGGAGGAGGSGEGGEGGEGAEAKE